MGRIDRLDTLYTDLYYYILVSNSNVDRAIQRALQAKKNFNWRKFMDQNGQKGQEDVRIREVCQI
jgi:hypothetical protein